jgi:hypothetical protein
MRAVAALAVIAWLAIMFAPVVAADPGQPDQGSPSPPPGDPCSQAFGEDTGFWICINGEKAYIGGPLPGH